MSDRDRFDLLVAPHEPALRALARRLTGDAARADDLLQVALVQAFARLDTLRSDGAARAWATRILVRAWLDAARRREPTSIVDPDGHAAAGPDPERAAQTRELSNRLDEAFDTLPADQSAAVWLVDAEGFSFADAAETLGVAPGTAASRVARGRVALRAALIDLDPSRKAQ